ncbi:MAG: glycine cleavage system aminomethyltransferase GcvT [Hyphomicrobiaceae bacterium]|nr:glycine cleavage system aminomethyltransferase GcvT [Hyphomicrobiaceae bacterium]
MTHLSNAPLKRTPLYSHHVFAGAKFIPFSGYEMPLHYNSGILEEHKWTRENAGLFDISHMGVAHLLDKNRSYDSVAQALELLVPSEVRSLAPGCQRYTQLTNVNGGILDDLIIARPIDLENEGKLIIVVNASRKDQDFAHISSYLPKNVSLQPQKGYVLLAIQGPASSEVLTYHDTRAKDMPFMSVAMRTIADTQVQVGRSGYTGEDGFEMLVPLSKAGEIWKSLLSDTRVKPVGLGARNCLRLEAGLCLYGHDIDEKTSPIEACLTWSIQKSRRNSGGFLGDQRILSELRNGPFRKRVGIKPAEKILAREGTEISDMYGNHIGHVTSGGFGPSVNGPIAMGYVLTASAKIGTNIMLRIRGRNCPAVITSLPFVHHRYKR